MNKDNAHLFLPLVQALANGDVIQEYLEVSRGVRQWTDRAEVAFLHDNPERYRIKPTPREFWLIHFPNGYIIPHAEEDAARRYVQQLGNPKAAIVHCREVL